MPEQFGDKSFEATPHRRQQARDQGHVAYSQDLGSAALLLAGVLVLMYWGGGLVQHAASFMERQLRNAGPLASAPSDLTHESLGALHKFGLALLPILAVLAVAGALSTVLQIGLLFLPDKIQPDVSRLSPLAGMKRILSLQGVVRLGFGLFKTAVVAIVAATVVYQRGDQVLHASELPLGELARFLVDICFATALWVGFALLVLALLDYGFQKWKHEQDLRMTHQEIREEMKNLQGDPQVIARRRQVQRQMALNRIGDKMPKADVVVTNPTELAVAIQYDPERMAAPIVLAKGAGVLAQRIRRLALEHGVPIVERKPLAQLLYKEVAVNRPIPDKSYAAVAEVLAYVYQLKGKKMPLPPAA
ncbi:MAG: flagellar biosynthetic protein FlhB [Planctomycetota bacterium]|nr:MAG: flagellar biosynthetic protein FlhB [Planctomycetota bacterium]